ncbi:hypothetical protein RJ640_009099 [Escallonia rubra]|uniref:Peptidase S59 domain-containing protein n=1 Tax=Escallonia rubra TaxID=112253 RepID=A0AA88RWR8_9ASTE|nr:hypothetical protein RJ640_009099 [Escallonia rubra]
MWGSATGLSTFGQKPPGQSNSFGSVSQQTQSTFESKVSDLSTMLASSSRSAFGGLSVHPFGATSAISTLTSGFSSTPTFDSTGLVFGVSSAPAFGFGTRKEVFSGQQTQSTFGTSASTVSAASSQSAFGSLGAQPFSATSTTSFAATSTAATFGGTGMLSAPAFGFGTRKEVFSGQSILSAPSSQSAFGTPNSQTFGLTSTLSLRSSSTPTVGSTGSTFEAFSSPAFTFGSAFGPSSTPANRYSFGQSISAVGSSSLSRTDATTFEDRNPISGADATGYCGGSRELSYSPTAVGGDKRLKLLSISAMPMPESKSHEELRFKDYTASTLVTARASPIGFNSTRNVYNLPSTGPGANSVLSGPSQPYTINQAGFHQPVVFQSPSPSNIFRAQKPNSGPASTLATAGASAIGFNSTPNMSNMTSTGPAGSSLVSGPTQPYQPVAIQSPSPAYSFMTQTPNSVASSVGFNTTPSMSNSASTGPGTLSGGNSGFEGFSTIGGQSTSGQLDVASMTFVSTAAVQPVSVESLFRTAIPQMSVDSKPSVQYGISSLPVSEKKPAPARFSSLLTVRNLSQRRIRLPVQKYDPKIDGPKVPFFSDVQETPSMPGADAAIIPREDLRAFVIGPMKHCSPRASSEKECVLNNTSPEVYGDGICAKNSTNKGGATAELNPKPNLAQESSTQERDSGMTVSEHRAAEAATVDELMPKLRRLSGYYVEPQIQELAAKEIAEPGFCSHVKDFMVGRHGYGNIKFLGETDVRKLDLESNVQFNHREVIVYMDEGKKPPVGQGLNKPAVITLLNVKCTDKKTGQKYIDGPKVDKYREMLIKKAVDQGAEFVSYDPAAGEWKFRVEHFSRYEFTDDNE